MLSKCCDPAWKAIQQQPGPPRKASEALSPHDAIAGEKEHGAHSEYAVMKDAINAIGSVLDRFGNAIACGDGEGKDEQHEEKRQSNIERAPPTRKARCVVREPRSDRKHC